jgi:hypothetical protein
MTGCAIALGITATAYIAMLTVLIISDYHAWAVTALVLPLLWLGMSGWDHSGD